MEPIMKRLLAVLGVVGILLAQYTYNPFTNRLDKTGPGGSGSGYELESLTGNAPVVVNAADLENPTISFGYGFEATVTAATYTVDSGDCGDTVRFNRTGGVAVTLPLQTYPCTILFHNTGSGRVIMTADGGDIDGDATLVLQSEEGALLSVNSASAFWRGIKTTGKVRSGSGAPAATFCDEVQEAGVLYVRTDAEATNSSLYACIELATDTYTWEGPFSSSGGAGSGFGFNQGISSNTLSIDAGTASIGNYPCPGGIAAGTIEFTAGTGDAKVFIDRQCQLVVQTESGGSITANVTGSTVHQSVATPAYPRGSKPLYDLTITSATPTIDSDDRTLVTTAAILDGTDITFTESDGALTPVLSAGVTNKSISRWLPVCNGSTTPAGSPLGVVTGSSGTLGPLFPPVGTDPWRFCTGNFDDAEVNTIVWNWLVPSNWDGSTIAMNILWQSSSGAAGTAVFTVETVCIDFNTTVIDATGPTFNAAQTPTGITVTTAERLMKASISSLTTTGCAPGELMFIRQQRDGTAGGDSMDSDIFKVFGNELIYGIN